MADSSIITPAPEALFLHGAVQRWAEELRDLDAKRAVVVQKMEAAERLLSLVQGDPNHALLDASRAGSQILIPEVAARPVEVRSDAKWVDLVRSWVGASRDGLTYLELRTLIDKHPAIAARFALSDKGYYNAISRLVNRKELVRHNGRIFSAEAFERYRRSVAAGLIEDAPAPIAGAFSPMGEATLDIVWSHRETGILGKEIIAELKTDAEFNASLTPHTSGAYNVLARLVKRGQVIRRDDGLCFPGAKFPPRKNDSKWLTNGEAETV